MKILDPHFKYVNSASTDIRKTFARIRQRVQADVAASAKNNATGAQAPPAIAMSVPAFRRTTAEF